jgi:uncharacterized protein YndB with AHSA1/START domain
MTTTTVTATTAVHRIYIRATAERIWQAITDPEWTNRYGYTGFVHYDLRPGGALRVVPNEQFKAETERHGATCPDVIIDGEVLEADPPHRLVTTWRMLMDPEMAAEPHSTLTYEIKDLGNGSCSLTLVHECPESPRTFAIISGELEDQGAGGGHAWILSDLKSLLETGEVMVVS